MSLRALERAEGCFALARSTTFEGERANAVARGKAIAQAAGLPLGLFDIPGEAGAWSEEGRRQYTDEIRRHESPPASRFAEDLFTRPRSPFYAGTWTRADLDDVLNRFQAGMERAERQARDSDLERVRNERERRALELIRLRDAINFLWIADVRIYPWSGGEAFGLDTLFIAPDVSAEEYDAEGVFELASERGWKH